MRPLSLLSDSLRQWAERRKMTPQRALARRGEDLAQRYLERLGYRIVARNFRSKGAGHEVDLVAWHEGRLVFVEVKTRTGEEAGTPDRAVTPKKQTRIIRAAQDYARRSGTDWERVRFDVVAIIEGHPPQIAHYCDAFRIDRQL
jgi:putative endonuclease